MEKVNHVIQYNTNSLSIYINEQLHRILTDFY